MDVSEKNVGAEHTGRRPLTDEERAFYAALDPHARTTTKPWEMEVRSTSLKRFAWIAVVIVMAVHIFMGYFLDLEFTGATVTFIDKLAFPGVGVVISVLAYLSFTRPRVRANADGVEIRNIIGTRFYPWAVIYGLHFPEGARMARLELPEFEYVPMWAMQASDGASVVRAVSQFRELEARYMPQD
ncbi:PH domain-containing protein [Corynebacterium sp. YIM 101645]|uniref:PH domain-containing protein n=1 Tax=Corynebacterium lemuris TaxID=1859292 RepID=A0ABT2FWD7_9CORY|nr:PH domain-containing protein [Corynebacterium lemuris]MCS5479550.1 PH domain-containing protein [Corynebacterium lemuris]